MSETKIQEKTIFKLKIDDTEVSDFNEKDVSAELNEIEFDVLIPSEFDGGRRKQINEDIAEINDKLEQIDDTIAELNKEIEKLTNNADKIDYTVAVASGVLTSLLDMGLFNVLLPDKISFGTFDTSWGNNFINEKVKNIAVDKKIKDEIQKAIENAKRKGRELTEEQKAEIINNIKKAYTSDDDLTEEKILKKAIIYLEKMKLPGDNIFSQKGNGITPSSHHLDDLAHHPSLAGLVCSIIMQFTKTGIYQNSSGKVLKVKLTDEGVFGSDFPSKICCGLINWFYHLVSDMAGSKQTPGAGMGIPGPILSLAKEMAMIPGIRKTPLPKKLAKIFVEYRFDFRKELTLYHELGKQAIPEIINCVFVRTFYFIRCFITEYKEKKSLTKINWYNTLPFKNRTIIRMLTIATGTFTAVDLADASLRAGATAGFQSFDARTFILRVNFVGVGRFAIAVCTDVGMGIKKGKKENERIRLKSEQLELLNAKLFYKEADMWIEVKRTDEAIKEAYVIMDKTASECFDTWNATKECSEKMNDHIGKIIKKDKRLADELSELVEWGV